MEINQAIHSSGNLHILKPRKAFNKAFLKVKPNRSQIEQFKENHIQLLDRTNDHESEEFHKNLVTNFLKKTYYEGEKTENLKVTYNKHHVALGTSRQNCIWLRPRKSPNICHMEIKVGEENIEEVKEELAELGISYNLRKDDIFAISLQQEDLDKHNEEIKNK